MNGECTAFSHESNIGCRCSGGWKCIASEEQQDECKEKLLCDVGCCSCSYFEFTNDYDDDLINYNS